MKLGYIGEVFQRKPWLQKMRLLLQVGKNEGSCDDSEMCQCVWLTSCKADFGGKEKKPRYFKNINKTALPVHYMHQESAWMNSSLLSEWFHDCFVPEVRENLKKVKLKKKRFY
ncbi:hypothetical protein AVEN_272978-1 [Araneus ventricosus]|uniref:DDE-1 domain-containing protein n=1 Tax=Araneus ventricosus TaxID=182803 RepID=A0A4Y2IFM1_ARAVE|nr:hypothetical protein AVEN_272978-1 [Araneus ventricosus]